jgi:hypothetical protein
LLPTLGISITALLLPLTVRAQGGSPPTDPIGPVFRSVIDSIASTAGLASLRDTPLPANASREIRAYVGFGLGAIEQVVRLWEDGEGVHGWHGLSWPGVRLPYHIANGSEADHEAARRDFAGWVEQIRQIADSLGCEHLRQRPHHEVCTMSPLPATQWAAALGRLDSLGIGRLPHPADRLGLDGVTLVVEVRDRSGYRSYSYWTPRDDAADPDERAAAAIMGELIRLYQAADGPAPAP